MDVYMDTAADARRKISNYQFEKKPSSMGKTFGTIKKGDEEKYHFLLLPMEMNLLRINRLKHINNGRRVVEAVHVCLFIIDGYINKIEYDLDEHMAGDVPSFVEGILMSFDPFVNKEVLSIACSKGLVDVDSAESLREYYETPVKCLLRLEESIELWTKELGINGYFMFLEKMIGITIRKSDNMVFSIRDDFAIKA